MSCYFRHIKYIIDEAGIEVTPGSKRQIDQAFHQIVRVNYRDCPATWERLKQELTGDEKKRQDFIRKLQNSMR